MQSFELELNERKKLDASQQHHNSFRSYDKKYAYVLQAQPNKYMHACASRQALLYTHTHHASYRVIHIRTMHTYTVDLPYTHAHRATCAHTSSPATHPTRVVVTWLFTSWRCAWRFATQVEGLVSQMGRSHRPRNRFVLSPGKNTVNFNH